MLTAQLELPGVSSLKEKRRILKSLFARLKNDFNISISEVGDNDILRNAKVGVAIVTNSNKFGQQVINKIVTRIESSHEVFLAEYGLETY